MVVVVKDCNQDFGYFSSRYQSHTAFLHITIDGRVFLVFLLVLSLSLVFSNIFFLVSSQKLALRMFNRIAWRKELYLALLISELYMTPESEILFQDLGRRRRARWLAGRQVDVVQLGGCSHGG